MKQSTTEVPTTACCGNKDNPVMALALVRIGVGAFFLAFGFLKLFVMGPSATTMMMVKFFGISASIGSVLAWVVMVAELGGGAVVLLGSRAPKIFYTLALWGFATITVVGYIAAFKGDMKQFFWHAQLFFMIGALIHSAPRCPMGITGSCK